MRDALGALDARPCHYSSLRVRACDAERAELEAQRTFERSRECVAFSHGASCRRVARGLPDENRSEGRGEVRTRRDALSSTRLRCAG
eukprot:6208000-Pleurochrysis_carterae.AAC.2